MKIPKCFQMKLCLILLICEQKTPMTILADINEMAINDQVVSITVSARP